MFRDLMVKLKILVMLKYLIKFQAFFLFFERRKHQHSKGVWTGRAKGPWSPGF